MSKKNNKRVDNEDSEEDNDDVSEEKEEVDSEGNIKKEQSTVVYVSDFEIKKLALYDVLEEEFTPKNVKTGKPGKTIKTARPLFSYDGYKYWKLACAHVVHSTSGGMKETGGDRKAYLRVYEDPDNPKPWEKRFDDVMQAISSKIKDIYWTNRKKLHLSSYKTKDALSDIIKPLPWFLPTNDDSSKDSKKSDVKSPLIGVTIIEDNERDVFNTKVYDIKDIKEKRPKTRDIRSYHGHPFKCVPVIRIQGGYCGVTVSAKTELASMHAFPALPKASFDSDVQMDVSLVQGLNPLDLAYDDVSDASVSNDDRSDEEDIDIKNKPKSKPPSIKPSQSLKVAVQNKVSSPIVSKKTNDKHLKIQVADDDSEVIVPAVIKSTNRKPRRQHVDDTIEVNTISVD